MSLEDVSLATNFIAISSNPLPIYDGYWSSWPGFYSDPVEGADPNPKYQAFIDSMSSHPRYQFLDKEFMAPVKGDSNNAAVQPLNMLGKLQARWVAVYAANELENNADFQKLKILNDLSWNDRQRALQK